MQDILVEASWISQLLCVIPAQLFSGATLPGAGRSVFTYVRYPGRKVSPSITKFELE